MAAPILTLDFARTRRFDRRLVFARPSPALREAAPGILRAAPPGQPRPEASGLLVEPAATNLVLHSGQYGDPAWLKTSCTVAPGAPSPDGGATAWTLVETTATTIHRLSQRPIAAEGLHTASIYVKPAGRHLVRLRLLPTGGSLISANANLAAGTLAADSSPGSAITAVGDGWYRLSVTGTLSGADNQLILLLMLPTQTSTTYAGDGSSGLVIWGAQLEAGPVATTHIATGAAAATRAAESCALPLARLPRWFPGAGTLLVEAGVPAVPATAQPLAALSDGSGANALRLGLSSGAGLAAEAAADGGSAALALGPVSAGPPFRAALAWNGDGFAACLDGGAVAAGAGPPPAGLEALHLGAAPGAGHARGWLRRVTLYGERLPDAALRRLTAA